VHRHLVMFASLFLFLWAAISIGCSSRVRGKLRLERSFQQISQFVWPQRRDAPAVPSSPCGSQAQWVEDEQHRRPFQCNNCDAS